MDPFQLAGLGDGCQFGPAEGDIRRGELWDSFRFGRDGGHGLFGIFN